MNSGDILYRNGLKIADKYFNNNDIDFLFGAIKKDRIFYKFEPEKIFFRLNIYPSHSGSFFIKSIKQKELGLYDINLDYCSDYDLFIRMIKKKKFRGMSTKKNEVIAKFDMNGMSSKIPLIKFYYLEMKVRLKNGQNLIYLFFLFILKILNLLNNKLFRFFKIWLVTFIIGSVIKADIKYRSGIILCLSIPSSVSPLNRKYEYKKIMLRIIKFKLIKLYLFRYFISIIVNRIPSKINSVLNILNNKYFEIKIKFDISKFILKFPKE